MSVFDQLAAPFDTVHWRAQSIRQDGASALALAYIDARHVMARLDEVVGPENWEDAYHETPKGRLICTLRLRVNGEWISKSDGAGDTDVEGDKGAISDALKRAAVKWGIGRYLYDLPDTWADCEPMKDRDGKMFLNNKGKPQFKKWTPAGLAKLNKVAGGGAVPIVAAPPSSEFISDDERDLIATLAQAAEVSIQTICEGYNISDLRELPSRKLPALLKRLQAKPQERKAA